MSLVVAIAAAALAFTAMTFMTRARAAQVAAETRAAAAEGAAAEAERLGARVRVLQRDVEVLSAIREIALIANDDVSFERILGEVLKILEDIVEARELAIWLADESGGGLRLRAVRAGGEARFVEARSGPSAGAAPVAAAGGSGSDLEVAPDRSLVDEAYKLRRTLRRAERGEVAIATLLYADAEIAGVLSARVPARPGEDAGASEGALEALAKHVALSIKKPTLYDRAVVDALTRLYTKRHFTTQVARLVAQARRSGASFALVIADVDHFKRVNDTHGHVTGDIVLAEIAATLRATIREADLAFRYGGEEMVVLAPDTDLAAGRALAERLRAAIESRALRTAKGEPLRVTASFGVAAFGVPGLADAESVLAAADKALYAAKEQGRNRVRAHGDPARAASRSPVGTTKSPKH